VFLFCGVWCVVSAGVSFTPCTWIPSQTVPFARHLINLGICIGGQVAVLKKGGKITPCPWEKLSWDYSYFAQTFQFDKPIITKVNKIYTIIPIHCLMIMIIVFMHCCTALTPYTTLPLLHYPLP
jgi:hypothetical protein